MLTMARAHGTDPAHHFAVIRMTLTLTGAPGESWRLAEALRSLMVPVRAERGCLHSRLVLSTEAADPASVRYAEEWDTEADLRSHVRSERFLRLLAVMELSRETPQLEFELPAGPRGLDYVAEVRRDLLREDNETPPGPNGPQAP